MKNLLILTFTALLFAGCDKDLSYETKHFERISTLPCKDQCPTATLDIVVATGGGIVSDSINNKVFSVLKEIVYFGEKPYSATNYDDLLASFIASYDQMKTEFPKDIFGWEAKISSRVGYESENVINIVIDHYTFTGGAHGYSGQRSLLFDPKSGKTIVLDNLFSDLPAFKKLAEQKFRIKYEIGDNDINSGGLMFENEEFALPQNIFFNKGGLLLHYNAYEIASYADGDQKLLIPYTELGDLLTFK